MVKTIVILIFSFFSLCQVSAQNSLIKTSQIIEKYPEVILEVSGEKYYVDPSFFSISEKGIKLRQGEKGIFIGSIHSDKKGIYIKNEFWPLTFICDRCGRANNGFNWVCEYCGEPRPD